MDNDESRKNPLLHGKLQAALSRFSCPLEAKSLQAGDFALTSARALWIGAERKTSDNLVGSLTSGELSEQIRAMQDCYAVSYVLHEGWMSVDRTGHLRTSYKTYDYPWSYWMNFKAEAQEAGVRFLESPNQDETARVLSSLWQWWQEHDHHALRACDESLLRAYPRPVQMLAQVPGWGIARSQLALSHFGTLRNLFNAKVKARCGLDGIGAKLAGKIDEVIDAKYTG